MMKDRIKELTEMGEFKTHSEAIEYCRLHGINELHFDKYAFTIAGALMDAHKMCDCEKFQSCSKCAKKTEWKDRLRANHKKEYWVLKLSTSETRRLFYDKKHDRWYEDYDSLYWYGHNTMFAEIKPPKAP